MNMRNATCVGTDTSKVPTRVTLLFISYSVPLLDRGDWQYIVDTLFLVYP